MAGAEFNDSGSDTESDGDGDLLGGQVFFLTLFLHVLPFGEPISVEIDISRFRKTLKADKKHHGLL